ncbi:hypothetical protein GCM10011490_24430 [Pseudoclavibacter endophyticus]|uniref:Uncharacterized protein n=1 Tax=Pseudoclavibacter endophyticus TaxID=1778590 RepID=A0A6H9WFT1_9MICO|nr:hypothetical protein [Pseudoclavibacter endophyticus]KAB1647784.1 hypothetical protein F8O04_12210 [Pseudoclavibacter endophyticus]GGA72762.1 hypothetical protein GCM10011490_24430 [Pseudoclavibacter endophyticus]
MTGLARRLLRSTVWAPESQPEGERDYHLVAQMDLPIYDLIIIAFATLGLIYSMPATQLVWGEAVMKVVAGVMLASAIVALIGLVFRLEMLELFSKGVMVAMLITYPSALLTLALGDVGERHAIAVLACGLIIPPQGRMRYLVTKALRRRDARRAARRLVREITTAEIPINRQGAA